MNRTGKGLTLGLAGGIGTQIGQVAHYAIERGTGDLPAEIDQAVIAIVAATCAFLAYKFLPEGSPK